MRRVVVTLLGVSLFAVFAVPASFALGNLELYSFSAPAPSVNVTYNANQETDAAESLSIFRIIYGSASPSYFVTFSTGGSHTFAHRTATDSAGDRLNYQLVDNATARDTLKDLSVPLQPVNLLSGTNSATGAKLLTNTFTAVVPAGQVPPAGTYTDAVTMRLYAGTLSSYRAKATQALPVTIVVPATAGVSLVPSGGSFVPGATNALMNFGDLRSGETRSIDLLVKSNGTYRISLQSQNSGVLAITSSGSTSTIPYTLTFNGAAVALSSGQPVVVASGAGPGTGGGRRYPIQTTIGNLGNPDAGTYQDNITITVTAN